MTISIVLADDHQVLTEGLTQMINAEKDMSVAAIARNGEEAVAIVKEQKPDVVLMDIHMPHVNGVEATREIKKILPQTEVIVLTMYDKEEYLLSVIRAGAAGYLLKDSPTEDVIEAIRVVAKGKSMLHPSMAKKLLKQYSNQYLNHKNEAEDERSSALTPREKEVLQQVVEGKNNKEIAQVLKISEKTVKIHLHKTYKKLGVKSRTQAMIQAMENDLL